MQGIEKDFQQLGTKLTGIGTKLTTTITAPIVGAIGGSAKAAIDFETAFAGVRKTVGGTQQELDGIAGKFRDLAKTIPVSAVELSKIGEMAGQLGVQKDKIVGFTKTIADISVATNLTADQAGASFARLANIMKLPQDQFSNLGSAVVALGNFGASTEQEMLDMSLRLAGAGATAGLSAPQVLGLANALSSVGLEAEAGGTAMSKVIIQIATASKNGGAELNKFAAVAGVSAAQFKQAFQQDAGNAIGMFLQGLARIKNTGGDLLGTVQALGFEEVRLRDAMLRAANAGDLVKDSLALGSKSFKENTELTRAAEERYKTTANQLKLLWNQITDVGITLGQTFLPILRNVVEDVKPVVKWIADAAKSFGELPQPVQTAVFAIAGIAAAIGPVLVVAGTLISSIGAVVGGLALLAPASATVAVGATTASLATAGLSAAFSALWPVAAGVAAFFAGWKFGSWIGEITGATDAVGKFAARMLYGKAAADEYARSRAFATANPTAGQPAPTPAPVGVPSPATIPAPPPVTGGAGGGKPFNPLAGLGAESDKEAKKYAKAIEDIRRAQIPLTESQKQFALQMQTAGVSVETTATKLRVGKEAVDKYLDGVKNGKEIAEIWIKAQEKMGEESSKFIRKNIAETEAANLKIAAARGEAIADQLQALNEFSEKNYQLTLTGSQRNIRQIQLERDAEIAALKKKFDAEGPLYDAAKTQIDAFYQNQIDVASGTYDTLEQRMRENGVATKADLADVADRAEVDYQQMLASGLYTAQQLEEAFARWRDADANAGRQWVSSWVTGLGQIASALGSLGGRTGAFGNSLGGIVSNLKTASEANKQFGGSLGVASGMFSSTATGAQKFASAVQTGTAIAGGAMEVWAATANKGSKAAGALAGAMSGAKAGAAFGPYGAAIGAAAGALVGFIRNMNAGRKAVEDFAKSAGGFDALREQLNALGDEGEKLWVKLTQKTPKGDAKAAAAVVAEIKAALDANKQLDDAISSMGFKTRAELNSVADTAKKVFEKMQRDGTYSAAQLSAAWAKYQAAVADSNSGGMASAATAAGYKTRDELKSLADQAVALWKYMRDSGQYSAEAVADAWTKAQEASAAAGDAAAAGAIAAQKAVTDLDAELKTLNESIANEAPEDEMGSVEKLTRERIAAVQAQRDEAQKALDATTQAATENADAQTTAQTKMFDGVEKAVNKLTDAINKIPRDIGINVRTRYSSEGTPPSTSSDGEPPVPPEVPGAADGVFATKPLLRVFGEGGEPELGGPVDFMRDALVGALTKLGATDAGSSGSAPAGITLVVQGNDTGELKTYLERTFMPAFIGALRRNAGGSTSDLVAILQNMGL